MFFIIETKYLKDIDTSIVEELDGVKIYIKTIKNLIGDINQLDKEKRIEISELIKQEISEEFYGLSKLVLFKEIKKKQKFDDTTYFNNEDLIYFSKKEQRKIDSLAYNFTNDITEQYCILGNPCSGKTTIAYAIIQKIKNKRIFYLNLTEPIFDESKILEELIQISHCHSLVILDNIHDNIKLFLKIKNRLSKHKWIKSLFLSRYYKTFDEYDENSIYDKIEEIKYYRIDLNEDLEEKISGIISKKIDLLKIQYAEIIWFKGNYFDILKNTSSNLLKLNIALRVWEKRNKISNNITFDKINQNSILENFYDEHKLNEFKSDSLYTYSLLYKNDIPFILLKGQKEINDKLKEKGIILKYSSSDYHYFPHKEYAKLIFDSFSQVNNDIDLAKKSELIINYITKFNRQEYSLNIHLLLNKFFSSEISEETGIVIKILENEKIEQIIIESFSSNIKEFEVNSLISILFKICTQIDNLKLLKFYNLIITYLNRNKLNLFLYQDYMNYSNLIQISELISIELPFEKITNVLSENEIVKNNSIVELTMRVSKQSRKPETVCKILNSLHFPEWLEKINKLPGFSNITNSLSELNTSSETKKLVYSLIRKMDWNKLIEKAKKQKIDQIAKSLRELQKIDISVGTNSCTFIYNQLIENNIIKEKLVNCSLSEYSKALSDLSNINSASAKKFLSNDLKNGILKNKLINENSLSNFRARVLELKRLSDEPKLFFLIVNEVTNKNEFITKIETEKDINSLLSFYEFAKENLSIKNSQTIQIAKKTIDNIDSSTSIIELIRNPKILKIKDFDKNIISSITPNLIDNYLINKKISYADDIFRVISEFDIDKSISLFNQLNSEYLIVSLLNIEINLCQSLEILNRLKNKVYKNHEQNCNEKASYLLNEYLKRYTKIERRYNKLTISDFLKSFYFGYSINSELIEKYCKTDLLSKLQKNNHKGFEIGPLFQVIRRISESTKGKYDKELQTFLKINNDNFVITIQNEDINKSLSGLFELHKSVFKIYADELLFNCRKSIILKANQRRNDKIFKDKIIPDLEKIGFDKAKVIIKELKK
ncbi:hypothetical protein [Flavobacterium xinjiangense]|uniref:hypothetical protein n=1 Tax=Flavobacterium xinjiangense TaxID=178356 RepID=UPI001114A6E8|nr:hypothetical protein [Flavobacterium xinjiangense]